MNAIQLVGTLGRSDIKIIGRDRFLVFMFMLVVGFCALVRGLLPAMNVYLAEVGVMPGETIPIPLSDVYPMVVVNMGVYTTALIVGTIIGFVLLDEKDQHTLTAMAVTPVPLGQYALYRVALPGVLGFVSIVAGVLIINQSLLPMWQLVMVAAGGSLTAPIFALFYAIVAENKLAGFAYSKFSSIAGWTILVGWFVPDPWQWLIGVFPPFLIAKAYWMALAGDGLWWLALILGIVFQAVLIRWMMQRFNRLAYR